MSMHDIRFPGESEEYRVKRDALLEAEIALRAQIEEVAALRRALPLGGVAENYVFISAAGPVSLAELFGDHDSLIIYSFMFGPHDQQPCPMCSAYLDSLNGQLKHITTRTALVVAARSPIERIDKLAKGRGWLDVPWVSAAGNTYARDYKSEMPNGAQVPMCNVFVKDGTGNIRHFWNSEMFFAPSEFHPRHVDMLWPLWHHFDLLPQGRGDFMPRLEY
jgi:predicted dithiol-disulfide oxidoreductase (DUF899 family)